MNATAFAGGAPIPSQKQWLFVYELPGFRKWADPFHKLISSFAPRLRQHARRSENTLLLPEAEVLHLGLSCARPAFRAPGRLVILLHFALLHFTFTPKAKTDRSKIGIRNPQSKIHRFRN